MSLADGMVLLGYVVLIGAFIVAMLLSLTNSKVKWQKVDVERLQKEVSELRQARWDYERRLQEQLRELRMEERAATEKLAEKLRQEFKPETTKSLAADLFKRMHEDRLKQLEHSMDRLNSLVSKNEEDRRHKDFKARMKEVEKNLRIARGLPPLDDEQQPPSEEAKN